MNVDLLNMNNMTDECCYWNENELMNIESVMYMN